jgi:hypothetical protein
MRGDLSETSAADLCRELARRSATGALEVDGPDGPGRVAFVDGRVVGAVSPTPHARLGDRLVNAGLLADDTLTEVLRTQQDGPDRRRLGALLVDQGLVSSDAVRVYVQEQVLDALFEVLSWRYGPYRYLDGSDPEVAEVPISVAVDDALVEVARRQREWTELSRLLPDLEAVPVFRDQEASASTSLEPDEFAVLASVDGERSVRQLANDLGYGEFEAARIVYGLALLGVVDIELPEDEVGAALDEAFAFFAEVGEEAAGDAHTGDDEGGGDDGSPEARATPAEALTLDLPLPEPSPPATPRAHEPMPDEEQPAGGAPLEELGELDEPEDREELEELAAEATPPAAARDDLDDDFGALLAALRDEPHPRDVSRFASPAAARAAAAAADEPVDEVATPADTGPTVRTPERADEADVSEFLRELSRLALDDASPPAGAPKPRPVDEPPARTASKPADDGKGRRKRGLFGWGGG